MADVPASSQLARLRQKAAKARRSRYVDCHLDDIGVVVRYGPITLDQVETVNRRAGSPIARNISVLVEACLAILTFDDGQLVSLDPDGTCWVDDDGHIQGEALTFASGRTAELLEVDCASDAVRLLYREANVEPQIGRDADDVVHMSTGDTRRMSRPMGAGNSR